MTFASVLTTGGIAAFLLAPSLSAQALLHTFDGDHPADAFGIGVAALPDWDGDGRGEVAIGAYRDGGSAPGAGSVRVHAGWTRTLLFSRQGRGANDAFGTSVANAGDVDGDGVADLVVGAPYDGTAGSATVFSGASGAELFTVYGDSNGERFGRSAAGVGDVNGDGRADFVVGAYRDASSGSPAGGVSLISGADGSVLRTHFGDSPFSAFGHATAAVGDVDGDGFDDYMVGAPGDDTGGGEAGLARVFSGATGAVLHEFIGASPGANLGTSVGGGPDLDGDGRADLIVGAPGASVGGTATIYSGADGSMLHQLAGDAAGDLFGSSVCLAGDIDGDGVGDAAVGAMGDDDGGLDAGSVRAVSGVSGMALFTLHGGDDLDFFGQALADAGDLSLDGMHDLIVGATREGTPFARGSAYVFLGGCCAQPTCPGAANSTGQAASLATTGGSTRIVLDDLDFRTVYLPAQQYGLYFYGPSETALPFGDGTLCVGGPHLRFPPQSAGPGGVAVRHFDYENLPGGDTVQPGETIHAQFWYRDPAAGGSGFNLSNGLKVTFLP